LNYRRSTTTPNNQTPPNPLRTYSKPSGKYKGKDVIWFNPTFNIQVSTSIGKKFFEALDTHIPIGHRLRSILNKNTIKLSYATAPNIKSYIDRYNKLKLREYYTKANKINHISPSNLNNLTDSNLDKTIKCNCRTPTTCPGANICRKSNIIYQCTVTSNHSGIPKNKHYIGQTITELKFRTANHNHTFRTSAKRHCTTLSNYIWQLRDQNIPFKVAWSIIRYTKPSSHMRGICRMCNTELTTILRHKNPKNLLNRPTENLTSCQHQLKLTHRARAHTYLIV
ncbi:hypothetical protein Ahia01_000240700, partial [Argonauta hians]